MAGYGSTGGGFDRGPQPRLGEYRDNPFTGGSGYQGAGYGNLNEVVDQISTNIFTINNNATSLERSAKQIGTNKDSVQLRDRIHSTEQDTNRVISETARAFHELSSQSKRADRSQRQQQKLQYERLMADFKDTLQRYHSLQKRVAERVRSTTPLPNQQKAPSDLINWGDADGDEAKLVEVEERRQQLQAQEEILEQDVALIQERETRIRQLESDILDINEIFRDLGTLVHEQGEAIDSIEQNVEQAYHHVETGRDELSKAAVYQKKARKKLCILVTILLVIAAIITIIIVVSVKH